jgi:ERCC4-type nuclease
MKLIIDEREHALYERLDEKLSYMKTPSFVILEKQVLPLGDIIIQTDEGKNVLLIERKTYSDLLASIKDGRYEEQSYRLIHSSGYPLVIITNKNPFGEKNRIFFHHFFTFL